MKKAVVLLSGGQDSTTCLFWALKHFDHVEAIGFDYGQMHEIELEFARSNAEQAGVKYHIKDVRGLLAPSSLTQKTDHNAVSPLDQNLPASFTPGRNLLFLVLAASYATTIGATEIVTGVCQTDYSGYPDCRANTMQALQEAITLGMGGGQFTIHTPLMYLTKAETFKLASELGVLPVIIENTLTDYNGDLTLNEWGRGQLNNPASVLRAKGYEEAKAKGWV